MCLGFCGFVLLVGLALLVCATPVFADHLPPVDPLVAGGNHSHENHAGHNHSGESLPGTNLFGVGFNSADLTGTDLTGADLEFAEFDQAILTGTNFTNADLSFVNFSGSDKITAAQLRTASALLGANLYGLDFTGEDFSGTTLTRVNFRGTTLTGANFAGASLWSASFRSVDLSGVDFTAATLSFTRFDLATGLTAAQLGSAATVFGARFEQTELSGIDFSGYDLLGINFSEASLNAADFTGTNLAKATFTDASVTGADFTNANLVGVNDFTAAMMQDVASIAGANLGGGYYPGSSFSGVDFTGTIVSSTSFQDVDLSGAISLDQSVTAANTTTYNEATLFPVGFDPVLAGWTIYGGSNLFDAGRVVVRSSDLVPNAPSPWTFSSGQAGLFNRGEVAMSRDGRVAFSHYSYSFNFGFGIFKEGLSGLDSVAFVGIDPAPGTVGGYDDTHFAHSPEINATGEVFFSSPVKNGAPISQGVFANDGISARAIALETEPVPGVPGGVYTDFSDSVGANDLGEVVFGASIAGPSTPLGGIFRDSGGMTDAVFLHGDAAPGTGGGSYLADANAAMDINDAGDVVAVLPVEGGAADMGIFLDLGGVQSVVALAGDLAPGTSGGTFQSFHVRGYPTVRINDVGDIVFQARIEGGTGGEGLFAYSNGILRAVALTGGNVPGAGSIFTELSAPAINAGGDIAFTAQFTHGGGVFIERNGITFAAVLSGDSGPASIGGNYYPGASDVCCGPVRPAPGLSDAGEIVFTSIVSFGSSATDGVFVVPEPGSVTGVAVGVVMLIGLAALRSPRLNPNR